MKKGVPTATLTKWKKAITTALTNSKTKMEFMGHTFVLIKKFDDGPANGWSALQAEYIAHQAGYKKTLVKQGEHLGDYELWIARK